MWLAILILVGLLLISRWAVVYEGPKLVSSNPETIRKIKLICEKLLATWYMLLMGMAVVSLIVVLKLWAQSQYCQFRFVQPKGTSLMELNNEFYNIPDAEVSIAKNEGGKIITEKEYCDREVGRTDDWSGLLTVAMAAIAITVILKKWLQWLIK